jgi:hypothetical protein
VSIGAAAQTELAPSHRTEQRYIAMAQHKEKWLVFVDTNILLDFYRLPGESAARQLKLLERHKDSLILTDQLKMEFLKNRQKVIIDGLRQLSKPQKAALPAILFDYQPAKMLLKNQTAAEKQFVKVRAKIEAILKSPSSADHVYRALIRIFDHSTPLNLARPNKRRYAVRNLARKRFSLGYPPRKANDYSLGDAINWEWIIECAEKSDPNVHVMIVSRDGDYGASFGEDAVLNDWLRREFKERVSQKRKIDLTKKLTVALRMLDEVVSSKDVEEEEKLLDTPDTEADESDFWKWISGRIKVSPEEEKKFLVLADEILGVKK